MRSKVFWKFYIAFLLVVLLSLFVSYTFLKSHLTQTITHQTTQYLGQLLDVVIKGFDKQKINYWNSETLEPVVDHLAEGSDFRITVIDPQGKVVGDSEVSGQKLLELENHFNRPEVKAAHGSGWGESVRYSTSVKKDMIYVARPYHEGVIRVSMPLMSLERSLQHLKSVLLYGVFAGALVSVFASLIAARRFAYPLREITRAAQAMTQGDFQVKVSVKGEDEIAILAKSFNELSRILGEMVQKLSEEKKQLRVTLDSMVEGVIVLDASGKILFSNSAFGNMFHLLHSPEGYTPTELFRNSELQNIVDCVITGKECKNCEIEIQREGIQYFRVQGASFLSEESIEGSVLVFYDITSLRKLEKIRKDFVANVSHELKTPLTAIKGYAETLLNGAIKDAENAPKFLKTIDQHADRLNNIVQDLLDLSKIESSHHKLHLEKINLAPFLDELRTTFAKTLEYRKMSFVLSCDSVKTLWVDGGGLRQILNNLVDNAIKYSSEGGKIEIDVAYQEGDVLFSVKDTGSGIPPEHLPRIFERFYRVDASRSRQLGGTGLGLSIVKHLVQHHGGEIWAESEMGQGSTFLFTIPQTGIV